MSARQPLEPLDETAPVEELAAAAALARLARPLALKAARYCDAACLEGRTDALYKLRVVLRRLRSLLWAFEPALPKERAERWCEALSQASRASGRARDWDILVDEMLPGSGAQEAEDFAELAARLDRLRLDAHRRNRRLLLSLDLPALLEDLMRGLDAVRAAPADKTGRQPLRRLARERVRKARRTLERKAGKARAGSLDDLHDARLALKRLRYLIEFFRPALSADEQDEIGLLARLQDELGDLNDKVMARRYLSKALGKGRPGPAARAALDWLETRIADDAGRSRAGLALYLRTRADVPRRSDA